jgi:hypothetical protein
MSLIKDIEFHLALDNGFKPALSEISSDELVIDSASLNATTTNFLDKVSIIVSKKLKTYVNIHSLRIKRSQNTFYIKVIISKNYDHLKDSIQKYLNEVGIEGSFCFSNSRNDPDAFILLQDFFDYFLNIETDLSFMI